MKADREPNRLPLRAGAMLLLAVAVVFLFLGAFSAARSGDETPAEKLAGADKSSQTASASVSPSAKPTESSASSRATTPANTDTDVPKLCVLNAGNISGLAKEVADTLTSAGFTLGTAPGNLPTSSITENTIFYGEGQEDAAAKVAEQVPGGAQTEARPGAFTRCPGELAVIVVDR